MSPMPDALEAAIAAAREALARSPRGDLPRCHREAIWIALGGPHGDSRKRRTALGRAAVEEVLPVWESSWSGDRTPHDLLALADAVIEGKTGRQEGLARRDAAFDALDDLSNRTRNTLPIGVGYAAAQTLATALGAGALNPSEVHPGRDDADVEPEEHDPSYFAALVQAGGPPGIPPPAWNAAAPSGSGGSRRRYQGPPTPDSPALPGTLHEGAGVAPAWRPGEGGRPETLCGRRLSSLRQPVVAWCWLSARTGRFVRSSVPSHRGLRLGSPSRAPGSMSWSTT